MNLVNRIKQLEKNIRPGAIPPVIWHKYNVLGTLRNGITLGKEERINLAVEEMAEEFNLSIDKARDYMDRIEPCIIDNCDDTNI